MKIGHIVSTMNNNNIKKLIQDMQIQADTIIVNQTDQVKYEQKEIQGYKHEIYYFNEKGVGLSRNNGIMRSDFDITIMSDDDMKYIGNYQNIISEAYINHPDADMIVFNVQIHENGKIRTPVKKSGRVHFFNCLRYGTVTFTFKTDSIRKKNIHFSLLFGGGAKYSGGEDTIFIWDCIKSGLNVYSVDLIIADVYNDDSTWFKGYTDKYFFDRGALFGTLSKNWSKLLCFQFAFRKKKFFKKEKTFSEAYSLMLKGIKEIKNK